ncbi:hypothetical protein, partial [Nostoc sp.]
PWERDQYGRDEDGGDWASNETSTWWTDTPGFVGSARLQKGQLLSEYKAQFYWKVKKGNKILHETKKIALKAEGDDNDNIKYTTESVNEDFTISV